MLSFWDCSAIIHLECVITGRKMNSKTCLKTPKRKKQHIVSTGEKTPTDPGTSGGIESIRNEVVSYPPSSLDVSLSDHWLFEVATIQLHVLLVL